MIKRKILEQINTPCYVIDERLLKENLAKLKYVMDRSGAKILLALKGFSMYSTFELIGETLTGTTSSSLNEAKLGREYMNKEVHIYSPAYDPKEFDEIVKICDHIVFNSISQYEKYKAHLAGKSIGLRINPEYSEVTTPIYDPCARFSRLGVPISGLDKSDLEKFDGLHFHTMCEQNSDTLIRTFEVVERKLGEDLSKFKWINFGGGHHITRQDYEVEALIDLVSRVRRKYGVQVYLEPGEAIALNTGFMVASVLDIVENEKSIAILDTSASCHMPDVIEMPYRPYVIGSCKEGENEYNYRLAGPTCLAGDIIGDYSFDSELSVGDKIIFTDMAHYTMVKNNTFNGINLPSIAIIKGEELKIIKQFGYDDYKKRL